MVAEIHPFDPTASITAAATALREAGSPFALIAREAGRPEVPRRKLYKNGDDSDES